MELADLFETELTRVAEPEPRVQGPWRKPMQMLADQEVGGRSSIHDDATAEKVGFRAGAIEGPLFVGGEYLLDSEVIKLSESRRVESSWVRTSVREAKS